MPREHIVILDWSNEELIRKLKVKHDLDWREVDELVKWHRVGDPRWVHRKRHGWRLRVEAVLPSSNREIVAYLKPIDRLTEEKAYGS